MKSTRSLRLTRQLTPMSGTSLSPSQNVPQSSRKWRNILKQITINLDLNSLCRFEWCAQAIALFKTGDSKGFEVVGIKSTINLHPRSFSHNIVGAGCAPSEHNAAPSDANVSTNLKESLRMVAGVTWWSCAWVTRWIPGWSLAWITQQSFAWTTRWNFTWIVWPWWIARQNFTWIIRWSFLTWPSPSETKIRSKVVWAVKALWMNATIRRSLELAGSFWTKNSKRLCAWVAVIIVEPIWS